MDKPVLAIDTTSEFGTYSLGCRQGLARKIAQKTTFKPVINLLRQLGGLRSCKIADIEVYGGRMRVYPGLNRSDKVMLGMPHVFDAKEREILAEHLKKSPSPSFIDIGANIGAYSLFVNGLGLDTKIIAIEADPEIFARLGFNLPDTVMKLNIAVADKEGVLPFYINESNRGENSLVEGSGRRIEVKAKTLKQVLDGNGVVKPSAIKIDVEGMEPVILGEYFRSVPAENLPGLILVEHIHNAGTEELIAQQGYNKIAGTKLNAVYVRHNG